MSRMYFKRMMLQNFKRRVLKSNLQTSSACSKDANLVLSKTVNQVTTLTMNNPTKFNGWTVPMVKTIAEHFAKHGKDTDTKVLILTGSDPYY